jgi:hypothetical protein
MASENAEAALAFVRKSRQVYECAKRHGGGGSGLSGADRAAATTAAAVAALAAKR